MVLNSQVDNTLQNNPSVKGQQNNENFHKKMEPYALDNSAKNSRISEEYMYRIKSRSPDVN